MRFSDTSPINTAARALILGLCLLGVSVGSALAAAPKATHAESSSSPYMALPAMPVSIISGGARTRLARRGNCLNAPSLTDRQNIERLSPRLRDLYIQVLNLYASRDLKPNRPPNADIIARRLQQATDQILGPDHAQVLLRQVIIRRAH